MVSLRLNAQQLVEARNGVSPPGREPRRYAIGLAAALTLIVAAMVIPAATGWQVYANTLAPLHAEWIPRLGWGTVPAIVLAVAAARFAVNAATHLRWGIVLLVAFASGLAWLLSLALVDGPSGLGAILDNSHEYLRTARSITDVGATLGGYIARIPLDAPDNWPTHVAGHPPGAVLFFWVLVQIGLGGWLSAGIIVTLLGATIPVAVAITLRRLDAESAARRALPFLTLGPSALWVAVSADGMFAAVAAWGLCCLAIAATSTSRLSTAAWGLAAGIVLGYCVFLSYGLILLAVLALSMVILARSWRALPWAIGGAGAVALGFAASGFAWWAAYPVLVERYWDGLASRRPIGYWIWGNLAALAISAGPILGSTTAAALVGLRGGRAWLTDNRAVVFLTLAATASIVLANASGMSKAEVERIWLPFVPWLLVGTALLPDTWRRWGLALQLLFAVLAQHLLFTGW